MEAGTCSQRAPHPAQCNAELRVHCLDGSKELLLTLNVATKILVCNTNENNLTHEAISEVRIEAHAPIVKAGREFHARCLTVKLRGRAPTPHGSEGAQFLSARGAKP